MAAMLRSGDPQPEATHGGRPAPVSRNLALAQMRAMLPTLGPSETRVAEAILDHSSEALTWQVSQLAMAANTSQATVVRACQRLGYSGWAQLRDVLARATADHPQRADDSASAAVERVLVAGVQQLENTIARLDHEAIERVVELLAGPGRLLIAGTGDLATIAHYAAARYASIGRSAEAPADTVMLHLAARGLKRGDLCLAIGYSGANTLNTRVTQAAVQAGATLIAITASDDSPLAHGAAIHLVIGVADPRPIAHQLSRVRVAHMLLLDALYSALELRLGTAESRTAFYDTIAQYAHPAP